MVMLGEIKVYNSEADAEKDYELHPIYKYPLVCRSCGKSVRVLRMERGGAVLGCDCREVYANYKCGVHP